MRIEKNLQDTIQGTIQEAAARGKQADEAGTSKKQKKSIDASELNLMQDDIQERKQKARRDAMKIIRDQFASDGEIDQNIEERRERIAKSKETANEALEQVNALSEQQEKLQKDLGITEDSQEQKDLELRMKFNEAMKPGSNIELTEEETAQFLALGEPTEYQQAMMELEDQKGYWKKEMADAHKEISEETQIIRGIKLEMLKYHGMNDAVNAAEAALQAASDEAIGMMMQDAMEHVQDEIEDVVEKAEELKEEKEEKEALQQEQKASQQENNQKLQKLPKIEDVEQEVEERLQAILAKQKLLEEDLKGIQVDSHR